MTLDIPDDDRTLLQRWLTSNEEPIDDVLAALEDAAPALRSMTLAKHVAEKTGVPVDTANELLFVLYSLANTVAQYGQDGGQDVVSLLFQSIVGELADATKRTTFERRVERLLKCKAVQISAKALHVMLDNPNSFCSARTLSELRPLFSEPDLEPEAAVVVHQLKLVYHTGPERRREEFFVTMDSDELEELRRVIDRAIKKDRSLAKTAEKLQLQLLTGASHDA